MSVVKLARVSVLGTALALALGGCNTLTQGTGGGPVSGSAGGSTSVGADAGLARCSETLGTLAVDDGRDKAWFGPFMQATQITTVEPMIRLIVQQSNCFMITSIGNTRLEGRMGAITDQQRNSGEFRPGSFQQRGQRVAADYFLEPAILFAGANTGGIGGAVGGIGGVAGLVGGLLVAGMSQNTTSVNLSLFNIRAGVQIAASEGSSTASNLSGGLAGLGIGTGGGGAGVLSAYSRTPQGQATVAAFVDAYNKLVLSVRSYRAQEIRGGAGTGGRLRVN